ncbi:MAG TPA: alpha/beta fold hydrolase, partial [Paludibacter sp.]
MKSRKLQLLIITNFLFVTSFCYSQVLTPRPTSISGTCGGYYEYLPQGYSTNTSQNFPLIVAVHGIGEIGNGTTDLGNLLNCWTAIPRLIANGGFPVSVSVGGQSFSFIVIAPQFNQWPYASDVNAVVDYAVSHYRVDQSRIYVTGLSMGGGSVWDFAGNYPTKAAAVVPVCGAASSDPTRAQAIANAKLPVWATHNQNDPTVSVS